MYLSGIEEIARLGIQIQSIICDGRKGLLQLFEDVPIQMCTFFHQVDYYKKVSDQAAKDACKQGVVGVCIVTCPYG